MRGLACAALIALTVACQGASEPLKDPIWGKQACSSCAMLISDPDFAAQLLTRSGDHLYFDDVGCMAAFLSNHSKESGQAWVRDPSGHWVSAELAHFDAGAKTPMDYGFVFSSDGKFDWNGVRSTVAGRSARRSEQ